MSKEQAKDQDTNQPEQDADLDQQIDQLIDAVDSLAEEVLTDLDHGQNRAQEPDDFSPPDDPSSAVDDAGLSETSPVIQDGDRVSVDEVVSDVDQELERMEKLVHGMSAAHEEVASIRDDSEAPATQEPGIDSGDVAEQIPAEPDRPEPIKEELELDDVLATLKHKEEGESAAPVAAPPAEPEAAQQKVSPKPPESESIRAAEEGSDEERAPADRGEPNKTGSPARTLAFPAWVKLLGRRVAHGLLWLLDGFDAQVGNRLSPLVKELMGYCAVATLVMALVAIVVDWLI